MADSVLITGGGQGLGLETALYLAARGFKVYATVPEPGQRAHVEEQAAAHGVELHVLLLDVTDPASITAAVQAILAADGSLFGLVNNAGISLRGYFEDLDDDEIRRVLEVNLFGLMAVTQAALPHMRRAGRGRLIFISSIGGRIGAMARTAYCASKFGVEGFAEALMQEVAPLGLSVSIVEPAMINTERWTAHRGIARRAMDPAGPYYVWFRNEEDLANTLVRTSPTRAVDVALAVYQALTAPRPPLRRVVGSRASLVLALKRYLPGELFERFYIGTAIRRIARPSRHSQEASPQ
jgi:NAD(P)-dependent dehydrogenase (short-subunit alcohol dehydrogenase family)